MIENESCWTLKGEVLSRESKGICLFFNVLTHFIEIVKITKILWLLILILTNFDRHYFTCQGIFSFWSNFFGRFKMWKKLKSLFDFNARVSYFNWYLLGYVRREYFYFLWNHIVVFWGMQKSSRSTVVKETLSSEYHQAKGGYSWQQWTIFRIRIYGLEFIWTFEAEAKIKSPRI